MAFKFLSKLLTISCICFASLTTVLPAVASSDSKEKTEEGASALPVTGYYEMKPFLTNLSNNGTKLNYIKVSVVISVADSRDITLLEEHDPLLRDAIVTILSSKRYEEAKSVAGNTNRQTIQAEIRKKITDLTDECVGRRIVKNVIFTEYLVQ